MEKKDKMFLLVDQWRKSGLTRKEFAKQHGITDSSLEYWCRKRDKLKKRKSTETTDFVEIFSGKDKISETSQSTSSLSAIVELELPNGMKLKIY